MSSTSPNNMIYKTIWKHIAIWGISGATLETQKRYAQKHKLANLMITAKKNAHNDKTHKCVELPSYGVQNVIIQCT